MKGENMTRSIQEPNPLVKLVKEAEEWLEFAKNHKVSHDTLYWVAKILITRDKIRKLAMKEEQDVEQCISEMVCQSCGHELDCFCGCPCLCHKMV